VIAPLPLPALNGALDAGSPAESVREIERVHHGEPVEFINLFLQELG
jgi:hypothetical protein